MIHKKILRGWGNNFVVNSDIFCPINEEDILKYFNKKKTSITHGLGRSYGDSSLNDNVINLKNFEKKINFNEQDGVIKCSSNFSINEIFKLKNQIFYFSGKYKSCLSNYLFKDLKQKRP